MSGLVARLAALEQRRPAHIDAQRVTTEHCEGDGAIASDVVIVTGPGLREPERLTYDEFTRRYPGLPIARHVHVAYIEHPIERGSLADTWLGEREP